VRFIRTSGREAGMGLTIRRSVPLIFLISNFYLRKFEFHLHMWFLIYIRYTVFRVQFLDLTAGYENDVLGQIGGSIGKALEVVSDEH